eukprot:7380030-Prymnesium_polylepis.2
MASHARSDQLEYALLPMTILKRVASGGLATNAKSAQAHHIVSHTKWGYEFIALSAGEPLVRAPATPRLWRSDTIYEPFFPACSRVVEIERACLTVASSAPAPSYRRPATGFPWLPSGRGAAET